MGRNTNTALARKFGAFDNALGSSMTNRYWPSRSNGGHLGLAKDHTVLQGLGWEARIASETKLNTSLLASDKTALAPVSIARPIWPGCQHGPTGCLFGRG